MTVKKATIRKLANELDKNGTALMLDILRVMDSENIYYTSILAKQVKHTWANTSHAVNKLLNMGLIKSTQFLGAYRARYDNIKGLVLTTKGYFVKSRIQRKKNE